MLKFVPGDRHWDGLKERPLEQSDWPAAAWTQMPGLAPEIEAILWILRTGAPLAGSAGGVWPVAEYLQLVPAVDPELEAYGANLSDVDLLIVDSSLPGGDVLKLLEGDAMRRLAGKTLLLTTLPAGNLALRAM